MYMFVLKDEQQQQQKCADTLYFKILDVESGITEAYHFCVVGLKEIHDKCNEHSANVGEFYILKCTIHWWTLLKFTTFFGGFD